MSNKLKQHIKNVTLSTITNRQVIGLEDILYNFDKRFVSVRCVSKQAEIMKMNVDQLTKILSQFTNIDFTEDEGSLKYAAESIRFMANRIQCAIAREKNMNIYSNIVDADKNDSTSKFTGLRDSYILITLIC